MERTLIYTTENLITPLPVSRFLKQKGFSSQNLVQLKKDPSAVLANGIPCFMNHILQPGDTLTLHIRENHSSEKIPPVNLPLNIVYEDADLMVINKPAGMPIHPSMNNYYNSLANALAYYFEQQNCPFVFRCINRLDRDTSGLTIVAKHYVSAGILSAMIANKATSGITREYLAIAKGSVRPLEGTITAPLGRKEGSIIERTVDFENGESAVTHYRVLDEKNGHSLVSLILETGRTHQIRIHMKYLGYPLIGDYLYNPDMALIQRQALHAWNPWDSKRVRRPFCYVARQAQQQQFLRGGSTPRFFAQLRSVGSKRTSWQVSARTKLAPAATHGSKKSPTADGR